MTTTPDDGTIQAMTDLASTPFEAQLRRYETGAIDRHQLATWIAHHEWVPYEVDPLADATWSPPAGTRYEVSAAVYAGRIELSVVEEADAIERGAATTS